MIEKALKFFKDAFEHKKNEKRRYLKIDGDFKILDMKDVDFFNEEDFMKINKKNLIDFDLQIRRKLQMLSIHTLYYYCLTYLQNLYVHKDVFLVQIEKITNRKEYILNKLKFEKRDKYDEIFIVVLLRDHSFCIIWNSATKTTEWIDPNGELSLYKRDKIMIIKLIQEHFDFIPLICINNKDIKFNYVNDDDDDDDHNNAGYHFCGRFKFNDTLDLEGYCIYVLFFLLEIKLRIPNFTFQEIADKTGNYFFKHFSPSEYFRRFYFFLVYKSVYSYILNIDRIYNVIPNDSPLKKEKYILYEYFFNLKTENFKKEKIEKYEKAFSSSTKLFKESDLENIEFFNDDEDESFTEDVKISTDAIEKNRKFIKNEKVITFSNLKSQGFYDGKNWHEEVVVFNKYAFLSLVNSIVSFKSSSSRSSFAPHPKWIVLPSNVRVNYDEEEVEVDFSKNKKWSIPFM